MKTTLKSRPTNIHQTIVDIERDMAQNIGPTIDDLRRIWNDSIANEILLSACSLFCARAIGMTHIYTGEKLESVQKRFIDAVTHNVQPTMNKIYGQLKGKKNV